MEKKYKHTCLRCGYKWEGKLEHPKSCPNCKRYDHAVEKKEKERKI